MKTQLYILLMAFLSASFAFGGQENYVNRLEGNSIAVNATYSTYDSHYWDMFGNSSWPSLFTNQKVSNYVRLGVRPDFVHTATFSASVQVQIDYQAWGASGPYTVGTITQTLTVNYDANGNNTISDLNTVTFSNAHFVKVKILSASGTGAYNKEYIYLETGIDIERYYVFNNQTAVTSAITATSNNLEINWSVVPGAEFYEIEYVHVNKYTLTDASTYKPTNQLKYNFYLNSTRVDVTNSYYRLPKIYDKGYFLYRIRAIGKKGTNFSELDNGVWNTVESGTVSSLVATNPTNVLDINTEYDLQMNWSHQVAFTEGGKRMEGLSFSDGLGRGRQQVGLNPENGQVIISNIYYDELGRPAVSDMPTPVSNDYLHHFPNFNRADIAGAPSYQYQYFDLVQGSCPANSRGFLTTEGAGKYYSASNTNQDGANAMIPNAEGFPFSRVTYKNDFTGRIDKVSAAGPDLKMGSGKETQYVYASPNETELNVLFGIEVGDYNHYEKLITIDPNGQVYVQYMDMAGRVVASYTEGTSPTNVASLEDNVVVEETFPLLTPGDPQNVDLSYPSAEVLISQYISTPGDYTFEYGFTPAEYHSICLPSEICFDCVYDLELRILDECSDTVFDSIIQINGETFDLICNGGEFDNIKIDLFLTKQNYRISKKLSVNQASIDEYWCLYLENNTCISPLSAIFNNYYTNEPFSDCEPVVIDLDEEEAGPCDGYREAMLADLRPGGQYAKYVVTTGTSYSSTDPWSILTPYGSNAYLTTIDWQTPPLGGQYLDENGVNVTASVTSQGLAYFIQNFRPEWAELFLSIHPEYCHLQFCIADSASQDYNAAMMNIIEYDVAMDGNYFEPLQEVDNSNGLARSTCKNFQTDLQNHTGILDPFFSDPAHSTYEDSMNAHLAHYITIDGDPWGISDIPLSLWQYTIYLTNNCAPTTPPMACIDSCDECNEDQIWLTFRDLYLELKSTYVLMAQEAYAHANCPASACIGVNPTTCSPPNALLAGKVPNFVNTLMYGPILGTGSPADVYHEMMMDNCQTSCEDFADEWLADLSGCDFAGNDTTGLRQDLIDLCMAGCSDLHPMGSSTAPPGSVNVTINDVLVDYFGSDFQTSLCTDLLISVPGPYEELLPGSETAVSAPLDTCGCNYYFDHARDYQYAIAHSTVPADVDNLEEWIAHFTGEFIEDVDQILCECSKYQTENVWEPGANEALINSGLAIAATISCDKGVSCIDCAQLGAGITVLISQLEDVDNLEEFEQTTTYQTVLTNYFNRTYDFNLMAYDYIDFISRCHATPDNPYCVDNPLLSEWILQTSLLAMRGQLSNSISNLDLNVQNIVYEQGELKDHGQGNILNSNLSGSTLTMTYTGTGYTSCNFQLTLPPGATFGFADIVSFEDFQVPDTTCGEHTDFTCTVSYYDCGVRTYAELEGTSSCLAAEICHCDTTGQTLCYDPFAIPYSPCFQPELNQLMASAVSDYEHTIQESYLAFAESYKTTCAAAFSTEHESIAGGFTSYQYTLFYYDQAGNLARTVAPQGVHKLPSANSPLVKTAREAVINSGSYPSATASIKPAHDYVTTYNYNSYNQLVKTTNPDQRDAANPALLGATNFWYDRYGRLVASQNPAQVAVNKYSYVLFDDQGRPVQAGQTVKLAAPNEATELKVNDYGTAFKAWATSGTRTEVTVTQYDKPLSAAVQTKFATGTQDNLRLRVASVLYFQSVSGATNWQTDYETAIHYSYDIHGNVKEQIQDVPMLVVVGQTNKSTQYEYELVSGNVNKVVYQKDKADQITHAYKYDKLNRLREAATSTDKVHSDRHAKYHYYDYGPMARVELGQNKVQSMDYVYTINGWIKGMNSSTLNNTRDVGKDGGFGYFSANNQEHLESAIDVSAYTIGYFANDYKSIAAGTGFEATYTGSMFTNGSPGLYNGNIRNLVTSIVGMETMGSAYKYDQLNRLLSMDVYSSSPTLAGTNSWSPSLVGANDYKSTYSYDRNGNLKTLMRNGTTVPQLTMDNLSYNMTAPGTIPWNRLNYVTDAVGATANYDDIDGQSAGNYGYDALGQLTSDAAEGIQTITWRSGDKKVQKIERSTAKPNAPQMEFIYNPFGQRVLKIEKPRISNVIQASNTWKYSYYSYDANGQVLAVYDLILGTTTVKADLNELHIYGASRLGMIEHPVSLWNNGAVPYAPTNTSVHKSGEMRYEITNYLGNVNAVVNDRKIPRATLVRATFFASYEGWSSLNATLNPGIAMLQVAPTTTGSNANKTFTTSNNKRYILRLRTDKGSSSDLKVVIGGGSPITLVNAQQNTIGFTSGVTGTTTITVSQVTGSTGVYYIDHFELVEDHIYEATLKMSSDYYPFGMQMPGRGANSDKYRYGYTGKENDLETKGNGNSYDFGNRQYDPRLGRWLSLDPLKAKYPSTTPYCYALNTPIMAKDPDGNFTIFVNGYIYGVYQGPFDDIKPLRPYWSESKDDPNQFIDAAHTYFKDDGEIFLNGTGPSMLSTAPERQLTGIEMGKIVAKELLKEMEENPNLDLKELNIVTHSMGAAVAEGMISELMKHPKIAALLKKGEIVHMSACDADAIVISENSKKLKRTQLNYVGDFTLSQADPNSIATGGYQIPGVKRFGVVSSDLEKMHPWTYKHGGDWDFHYDTKTFKEPWKFIEVLDHKLKNEPSKSGKSVYLKYEEIDILDSDIEKGGNTETPENNKG